MREWKLQFRNKRPLSLILCDIDYFKRYNDIYGHQAGDECLKKVARKLKDSVKRPADLAARYGGEEAEILVKTADEALYDVKRKGRKNYLLKNINDYFAVGLDFMKIVDPSLLTD